MTSDQFQQFRKQQFRKWLWNCPVSFEYLNHDPEGQIAYVFHTKFDTHIDPLKEQSLPIKSGGL